MATWLRKEWLSSIGANRLKTPFIVVEAWHDDVTAKNYKYVFRAGPSNSGVVNETIAKWGVFEKFKKAFIIQENTDWGLGIGKLSEAALKRAGVPFETLMTIYPFQPDLQTE